MLMQDLCASATAGAFVVSGRLPRFLPQFPAHRARFMGAFPRAGTLNRSPYGVDSRAVNTGAEVSIKQMIGENIVLARTLAGISQRKLAPRLGTTPSRLSDYEHGRIRPADGRLLEIAVITGQKLAWFYEPHENGQQ